VSAALFTAAAAVVLLWWRARTDSLGRARPFPWFASAALVLAAGAVLLPWLRRIHLEHRLSRAASVIVGNEVKVSCESFGGAFVDAGGELGYVAFGPDGVPDHAALIKREQCRDLFAYVRSDKHEPSRDQIVAVHVLTHETVHMSGVTNEAETECLALQRDAEMARLLGAPREAAADLAVTYWRTIYPRMSTEYRSGECALGGTLDVGLAEAPWALTN
jgi:hypothetical protein